MCSLKNAAWIEDKIKVVTLFPCLLGHPVSSVDISVVDKCESWVNVKDFWEGLDENLMQVRTTVS